MVVVVGDLIDAGPRTLFDMEEQARAAELRVPFQLVVRACAHRKRPEQEVERLPDRIGMTEGTEIPHALALLPSHDPGPRPFIGLGDRKKRVALVIDEANVEPRSMLFDERILEHERLEFVVYLDPLNRLCGAHHRGRTKGKVLLEIVVQSTAQALCLAHIDDATVAIAELITPGRIGDRT